VNHLSIALALFPRPGLRAWVFGSVTTMYAAHRPCFCIALFFFFPATPDVVLSQHRYQYRIRSARECILAAGRCAAIGSAADRTGRGAEGGIPRRQVAARPQAAHGTANLGIVDGAARL
jgi:hypothetical protein